MGNKSKKNYVARRDVFKWTEHMDDAFIDALIRQQRLGNRVDSVFTTAAYDNMVKELRENNGMPFEKDHLKNRLKTLNNNFMECFDMFHGTNDFVWSPENKMWVAKLEAWKAFVNAKPKAKKWMTTAIAHHDELSLLPAKDRAESDGPNTTKEKADQWMNDGTSQLATPVEANSQADSQGCFHSATSLKGKKRKASSVDAIERQLKSIRDGIKQVARAIRIELNC